MADNSIIIKTFKGILKEFDEKLTEFNSIITNRTGGGAFDLLIRGFALMVNDAYAILNNSIKQVFVSTATGEFLDSHADDVDLTRNKASKGQKEFILKRDTDGGVLQIPVGDIIKTPVLPSRGQLRWFAIASEKIDLIGTADNAGDDLIDNSVDFLILGVEVGSFLFNTTDGSFGEITEVFQNKLVAKLDGGTANAWAISDAYKTQQPDTKAGEFTTRSKNPTTADPTGALLTDTGGNFLNSGLQLGQKIFNVDDASSGIVTAITATTVTAQLIKDDETGNGSWSLTDDYKIQSDLQITIKAEADEPGSEYNNMELLLGEKGKEVAVEIETGFTGVDEILSTGKDLIPGADLEADPELRVRIKGQWKALARGATKDAYIQFAKNSDPAIFDANVFKGTGATDVQIILSGVPGSRDITTEIGMKVSPTDNFDSLYTNDGVSTGTPRPLGIKAHSFIRARAPLTDIIFLSSVTEQAQNLQVDIKVAEGFDFATDTKLLLEKRLRALFIPEKTVDDVEIMKVGEDLLFSKFTKILNNTPGVKDWVSILPDPSVSDGNLSITNLKVFSLGTITVGEL